MNSIELLVLQLWGSFLVAKFLPFVLLLLAGLLIGRILYIKFSSRKINRTILVAFCSLSTITPVACYFALFPIYQGDLIDLGYKPKTSIRFGQSKKLVVIALPGCRYCSESTQHMKGIEPYTKTPIEYWVLGSDSLDLSAYQALVGNQINCELKSNLSEVLPITEGSFPTYVLIENGKITKAWHNDSFGVRSLNELN